MLGGGGGEEGLRVDCGIGSGVELSGGICVEC